MSHAPQHSAAAAAPTDRARAGACWLCRGPIEARALFCPTCRAVQPPAAVDHFARLDLPVRFDIDAAELDRRYFSLQRQLHPDRFASRSARERAVSQSQAVALNEAYETLKDPLSRAEYMLKLHGVDVNPDGCNTVRDPTLLMEQIERREALAEAATRETIDAIATQTRGELERGFGATAKAFAEHDLERAEVEITRLKYLSKLLDETRIRRAKLAAAGGEKR
ncbi:MAG TPA: Fe-S protein assembly co-chaperone HscB [Alphaproteobacteria bacterium]|nr:Fe-S protein assembly co-chaperone HscB [Alphaproteobacteria bacterium]